MARRPRDGSVETAPEAAQGLGFRAEGFEIWGLGFRVSGSGFRVSERVSGFCRGQGHYKSCSPRLFLLFWYCVPQAGLKQIFVSLYLGLA